MVRLSYVEDGVCRHVNGTGRASLDVTFRGKISACALQVLEYQETFHYWTSAMQSVRDTPGVGWQGAEGEFDLPDPKASPFPPAGKRPVSARVPGRFLSFIYEPLEPSAPILDTHAHAAVEPPVGSAPAHDLASLQPLGLPWSGSAYGPQTLPPFPGAASAHQRPGLPVASGVPVGASAPEGLDDGWRIPKGLWQRMLEAAPALSDASLGGNFSDREKMNSLLLVARKHLTAQALKNVPPGSRLVKPATALGCLKQWRDRGIFQQLEEAGIFRDREMKDAGDLDLHYLLHGRGSGGKKKPKLDPAGKRSRTAPDSFAYASPQPPAPFALAYGLGGVEAAGEEDGIASEEPPEL